jgi:hypothetical protein
MAELAVVSHLAFARNVAAQKYIPPLVPHFRFPFTSRLLARQSYTSEQRERVARSAAAEGRLVRQNGDASAWRRAALSLMTTPAFDFSHLSTTQRIALAQQLMDSVDGMDLSDEDAAPSRGETRERRGHRRSVRVRGAPPG